jgi:hypothetical protein
MSNVIDPWSATARSISGDALFADLAAASDASIINALRIVSGTAQPDSDEWREWASSLTEREGIALWLLAHRQWPEPGSPVGNMLYAHLQAETRRN